MNRMLLLSAVIAAALTLAACSDDTTAVSDVTIEGVISGLAHVVGDTILAVYPQGTAPGPTGMLDELTFTTNATDAAWSLTVPGNTGNVYVFGWNDDDGDGGPTDPGTEQGGCSAVLNVGTTTITGVTLTFSVDGWCRVSP